MDNRMFRVLVDKRAKNGAINSVASFTVLADNAKDAISRTEKRCKDMDTVFEESGIYEFCAIEHRFDEEGILCPQGECLTDRVRV